MSYQKKLAITGANGYLGKHLIDAAVQEGWQVNAIVRREEVVKELEGLGAHVFVIKNFDLEGLKRAFSNCRAVVHLANVVCGAKELFQRVNVDGLKNVIHAADHAKLSRVIYISGLGVDKYESSEWAHNEYFRSKREAEMLLINGNLPYIIFRPSYILGPNDELIPEIITQTFDGEVIVVGDGGVPMQPIFVEDAVDALLSAAQGVGKSNTIYELVGPEILTMNRLVQMVIDSIFNHGIHVPEPKIVHVSYEDAPGKLDICKEMVDVMKCDLTPDPSTTSKELNVKLSAIRIAVEKAVQAKLFFHSIDTNKRAIVLLSGGIDSSTALFWGLDQGFECIALSINYNWRPKKEQKATAHIVKVTGVELIEINVPFIAQATDLLSEGFPAPIAINAPEGYIPHRNLIFYSIAAFFAEIHGCDWIIGGHIMEDASLYPDAAPSFFKSLENLIKRSPSHKSKKGVKILLPFKKMNKKTVIQLSRSLNVPLERTWSCYNDFEKPCGRCLSCKKREMALKELNL